MLASLAGEASLLARLASHSQAGCKHAPVGVQRHRRRQCTRASIDATNWDAEMSIFKQRIQKPNQLETLRNIEATMDIGKVSRHLWSHDRPSPVCHRLLRHPSASSG